MRRLLDLLVPPPDYTRPGHGKRRRALAAAIGQNRYALIVATNLIVIGIVLGLIVSFDHPLPPRPASSDLAALGLSVASPSLNLASPTASSVPGSDYGGPWSLLELRRHIANGEISALTVGESKHNADGQLLPPDSLVAVTRSGQIIPLALTGGVTGTVAALRSLGYGDLLSVQANAALTNTAGASDSGSSLYIGLLLLGGIFLFVLLIRRRNGIPLSLRPKRGGHFRVHPDPASAEEDLIPRVTMADVAGCEEAKFQLTQTIAFLRDPAPFHALGAKIPRGVLLYGPPGTGKTLLAKAVAHSAEVPFISASGSEFAEMYVGVGARRVRDLFAQARKFGRAIIFIDEFDALGRRRTAGGIGSNDERETTVNQLLVELDGFETTTDVVVIAATNRIDALDEALLRPGRFSRKVEVHLPDLVGRRAILAVHARGKPFAPDADLEAVARKTTRFSGAQLEDLLNEAAIAAAERGAADISGADLRVGMRNAMIGVGRQRSMDERERSIIAAHEAGHAVCGQVWATKQRVEEISLFTHGEALGYTHLSEEDNALPSETDLRARLVALMGGRAAEEILFSELTGGASNDFEQANRLATTMVTKLGLGLDPAGSLAPSGRGRLSFFVEREGAELPLAIREAQSAAIGAILEQSYAAAKATLFTHLETLSRLAAYCFEYERIDGDTFEAVYAGTLQPSPRFAREWSSPLAHPRAWADIATLALSDQVTIPQSGLPLPSLDPARPSAEDQLPPFPERLVSGARPIWPTRPLVRRRSSLRARARAGLLSLASRIAAFAQKEV